MPTVANYLAILSMAAITAFNFHVENYAIALFSGMIFIAKLCLISIEAICIRQIK